jgi:hypothetical protein
MWISEIAERTIIAAMASLDVTFRASRVDDDPSAPTERKQYPCITIVADGGTKESTESLSTDVVLTVSLTTHYKDDPKRTTLAGLEDQFRKITDVKVNDTTLKAIFDQIAADADETRFYKGLTEIAGQPMELSETEQTIMTTMKMHVCGS